MRASVRKQRIIRRRRIVKGLLCMAVIIPIGLLITFPFIHKGNETGKVSIVSGSMDSCIKRWMYADYECCVDMADINITDVSIIEKEKTMEGVAESPILEEKQNIILDIPLSADLQEYIFGICEEYDVEYPLVLAMIEHESMFDASARSSTEDSGLMQINDINLRELRDKLGITDIYDPYQNVLAGVYLLSSCFHVTDEIHPALMCYNMGADGASNLWEQGIYSSKYSRETYQLYEKYKAACQ